jgi:hypothetical protein
LIAYRHGLRASELVELRWDDIDFRHGKLMCDALRAARLVFTRSEGVRSGHCASYSMRRRKAYAASMSSYPSAWRRCRSLDINAWWPGLARLQAFPS